MFSLAATMLAIIVYMSLLFFVARWSESGSERALQVSNSSWVYALSLGVFCTTWTYYGSVGLAANQGLVFVALYLGASLSFLFCFTLLRKFIVAKERFRISSLADMVAVRYNNSQRLAALVTIICLLGVTPYLAIQLKAIISSADILINISASELEAGVLTGYLDIMLIALVVIFTIVFGVRHLDPTERHPGMMVALAMDSLVKLVAFFLAGYFICYVLFDGVGDIMVRAQAQQDNILALQVFSQPSGYSSWVSLMLLGFFGVTLLPRQFHVSVVENNQQSHLARTRWVLPLYLLLISLFVVPIAMAGLLLGYSPSEADTFVLRLPVDSGAAWVSMLVFLGGFSAGTGMIMVSVMTLSTMCSNNLLLPLFEMIKPLHGLRRYLLQIRWLLVVLLLVAAYAFNHFIGESYLLVQIGLISFVAVLQFVPALFLGILWRDGNRYGAAAGMSIGTLLWFYCMVLPAIIRSGWLGMEILEQGLFGLSWLKPEQLFGLAVFEPLSHVVAWSLGVNLLAYLLVSMLTRIRSQEQIHVNFLLDQDGWEKELAGLQTHRQVALREKLQVATKALAAYMPDYQNRALISASLHDLELSEVVALDGQISILQLNQLEQNITHRLGGAIGAAAASKCFAKAGMLNTEDMRELADTYRVMFETMNLSPVKLLQDSSKHQDQEQLLSKQSSSKDTEAVRLQIEIEQRSDLHDELERLVAERTLLLQESNDSLHCAMDELKETQIQLAEADKMAALGGMVAGIAHDVSTPIGVGITATSHLNDRAKDFYDKFHQEKLKRSDFDDFEQVFSNSIKIISSNINRAAELMSSFQRVASDQTSGEMRQFYCKEFLESIVLALSPRLRRYDHEIRILCDEFLEINSYPGALSQIISNLLMNSINHAYPEDSQGIISLSVTKIGTDVQFIYSDDGRGLSADELAHIFDAFYTTKKDAGGTGLGTHIIYNLVTQILNGTIHCYSEKAEGTSFHILFPEAGSLSDEG